MLMVTPCTDWYLIFTGIAKGNVALGASILPLNFILQLLLLPVYIFLIAGSSVKIDFINLTESMIISLFIPLILATLFRKFVIKRKGINYLNEEINPKACDYQGYFLNLAIIAMFASQGKILLKNPQVLLQLLLPILLFFIINLIVGQVIGRNLGLSREDNIALNLTTLARNSPIALAIAVSAFPNEPLISLALIIGPLIELPVLFVISTILLNINTKCDKVLQ
jgi:ACR3 family arsenite efflux pump ArsB